MNVKTIQSNGSSIAGQTPLQSFVLTGVNLNAVADNAIAGLPAKWRLAKVTVTDASVSLALLATVASLYTAAAAGGTNMLSALVFTGLTGATKLIDGVPIAQTDYQTATTIYFRSTVAAGSPATARVIVQIEDLT